MVVGVVDDRPVAGREHDHMPAIGGRQERRVHHQVGRAEGNDPAVHEGDLVEVVHGPLKGITGRLTRKDAQHARLVLSVDLIGQAVSVDVDASDMKPY